MLSWSGAFPPGSKGYKDKSLKLFIMHWLLIVCTSLIVAHLQLPSQKAAMVDYNNNHSSISEDAWTWDLNKIVKHLSYLKDTKIRVRRTLKRLKHGVDSSGDGT